MDGLTDLRHAARLLIRRPGFTLTATATMAIAIAGNTIVFALIRGILLAPLPLPMPDRLVRIEEVHPAGPTNVTGATFTDLRHGARTLETVAAFRISPIAVSTKDQALQLTATTATDDYFGVLGLGPAAGRLPDRRDFVAGAEPVAVIGVDLARRLFGSEREAVGQIIRAGGAARSVAGVVDVPRSAPGAGDLWLPHSNSSSLLANRRARLYTVIARLRPGASTATASAELEAIAATVLRQAPEAGAGMTLRATSLHDRIVQPVRASLLVLWGAVGVLLVIAFANVANLLLMDGSVRARELTLRSALGAPRSALVRQLATETALLGLVGGAAGALLGAWGVAVLRGVLPASLPRVSEVRPDLSLILSGVALSIVASVVFGFVPAIRSSRRDAAATLRSRDATGAGSRLRDSLVAAEVALTVVLLFGAGLLGRSLLAVARTPMGFEPRGVAAIDLSLPGANYPNTAAHARFYSSLLERLAAMPGIESAGVTGALPLSPTAATTMIPEHGHADQQPIADVITATPGVFRALQIRLLRGRLIEDLDRAGGPAVAVVNETAARTLWPAGIDPLGKSLEMRDWGAPYVAKVIGIVNDVRQAGGDRPAQPAVYYPLAQFPQTTLTQTVVLRSAVPLELTVAAVRGAVAAIDSGQPIGSALPMETRIAAALAPRRFNALLLGAFAACALLLAGVGIYGIVAFAIAARAHEIAIRIALGAPPRRIVALAAWRGLGPIAAGTIVGGAASWAAAAVMQTMIVGVPPRDAVSLLASVALVAVAGAAGIGGPARRAVRVDPATSFRST